MSRSFDKSLSQKYFPASVPVLFLTHKLPFLIAVHLLSPVVYIALISTAVECGFDTLHAAFLLPVPVSKYAQHLKSPVVTVVPFCNLTNLSVGSPLCQRRTDAVRRFRE